MITAAILSISIPLWIIALELGEIRKNIK